MVMTRIAIPVFGDHISNRIDCSEELMLVSAEQGKVRKIEKISMRQFDLLDRLKLLIKLKVDVLICNGITEFYSHTLGNSEIKVIPWIKGEVKDVLERYLKGKLNAENSII
jgi:predicted Fe-Mo cluster-binding NifX family protein